MLPVYKAVSFQSVLSGGRTKPWLVLVDTGRHGIQPYVMKLFDTLNLEARDHVTAEVIGYVLAKEFDFNVPEAAFIETDENFLSTIEDQELYRLLERKDERLKFGSALVDGNYLFDSQTDKKEFNRLLDLQTLFAFDNLIRNRDRNNHKPNLLVKADESYVIDHEMGLELDQQTLVDFKNNIWDNRFVKYHICYDYLINASDTAKSKYFDTFQEYLRNLNFNILNSYFHQLIELGYSKDRHGLLNEYFEELKNNSTKFVRLLRSGLDEKGI